MFARLANLCSAIRATLGQRQIRQGPGLALNAHSGNDWGTIPVLTGKRIGLSMFISGLSRPILINLCFLAFLNLRNLKSYVFIFFRFLIFKSKFFMSNSVNLFEFTGIASLLCNVQYSRPYSA